MAKDTTKYTRENFRSSLLKKIIIRFDFTSVTDIASTVKFLLPNLAEYFFTKNELITNNYNLTLTPSDIKAGSIPINVSEPVKIFRFTESKIKPIQEATLDISSAFICLDMNCDDNYDSIDSYLKMISVIVGGILNSDSFTTLTRIGLRKIDGHDFDNISEAKQVFENVKDFTNPIEGIRPLQNNSTMVLVDTNKRVQINYTRSTHLLDKDRIRAVVDIDAYIENENLKGYERADEETIKQLLSTTNDLLFDLFKYSVTEAFLKDGVVSTN